MLARILEGDTLHTTTSAVEIREALAAEKRIWIDLERKAPEADAILAEVLKIHPLTVEDNGEPVRY